MQVEELIRKYNFHDSCVIRIYKQMHTIKMIIDLCMWKQEGYVESEDEKSKVVLKFNLVKDYTWDSDKKEEEIDYDTILKIEYIDNEIKMVLSDDVISIITFKCSDVDITNYNICKNNEVRAVFSKETIRVYQAYNNLIASEAVQLGTFGKSFKMDRMSWIKPSFLWMMNRCGWASKENQECVLAINIKREAFDYIFNTAVDSIYKENLYKSKADWKYKLQHTDIICQWDPERDINGNPLEYRSVQIGLRGEALRKYVQEWIVSIEDITEYVLNLKKMKDMKQSIDSLLPNEQIYLLQNVNI